MSWDGTINFAEFISLLMGRCGLMDTDPREEIIDLFKAMDTDGSGLIPTSKVPNILTAMGEKQLTWGS